MNPKLKLANAALGGIVATLAAGSIAFAAIGHSPLGHFRGADADKNGEITRAEWLQAAGTSFDAIDTTRTASSSSAKFHPSGTGVQAVSTVPAVTATASTTMARPSRTKIPMATQSRSPRHPHPRSDPGGARPNPAPR